MINRKDCFFLLLLLLAPFFFLSGTLTSSNTFFMRDLTYLFHPWRTLAAQMIQEGEMPLWNAYEMGGMPFLANAQSAILYPFTILFYLLHFTLALKVFHFFHYALLGTGFYLLGRKLGFNRWSAFAGSMVFAYNGYMLTRLEFVSVLGSLIWFPWIAIFLIQPPLIPHDAAKAEPLFFSPLLLRGNKRGLRTFFAFFSALALSFSFLGGYPQIVILEIFAVFLFCLAAGNIKTSLSVYFSALGIFLFLSAVQWIPTLELWKYSVRSGNGIDFEEAVIYALPWKSLLGLINPFYIFHHPDRFTGEKFFWIWSAWCGLTAAGIALFSWKSENKKLILFSVVLTLFGILWAMGDLFPWYAFLYRWFFPMKLFRYPPAVLYWTVIGVSFLVMCGLTGLAEIFSRWRGTELSTRGGVLFLPVPFLICLLSVELWHYSRHLLPTITPDYFRYTFSVIRRLQEDHPGTVMLSPKLDRTRKLADVDSLRAALKFRGYLFDLTNLPYRIKTIVNSGEPLALRSYQMFYTKLMETPVFKDVRKFFNFRNVTHFLTEDRLDPTWVPVSMENHVKIYRNPQVF
jgi:hypothetical protein